MPASIHPIAAIGARLLLAAIFLVSPLANLIPNFERTSLDMQGVGVPMPKLALVVAIAMLLVGSLSVIAGFKARWGAALLLLFLLTATYYFHAPWAAESVEHASAQAIHFLKNLGLIGAMLLIMVAGPGPGSLDGARR